MAKNSLKNLQAAASQAAGKPITPPKPVVVANDATATEPTAKKAKPSREGKIVYSFHLAEDFKRSFRLIQAQRGNGCSLEGLAAEAFNDLFHKYNVPTVDVQK